MCFHFRGGWKFGLQARHNRIDSLQGQNHVGIPIEEKIDFGGAAAGDGLNLQQTRHTVDGFFDRAGDHHEHLVNGHDAVVHADDNAWKIGVWKNGDGNLKCQKSAHQGQADDQKQNRARQALKPGYVRFGGGLGGAKGIGSWLHPRLLLVLFRGLRRITGFSCFVALVGSTLRRRGRFDLDRRVFRQRVTSGRDHRITSFDSTDNLGAVRCADADLHGFNMRMAVRTREQYDVRSFGTLEDGGGGHNDGVFHSFRGDGKIDGHSGAQCRIRLRRFDPDFDGGAAGVERRTDESYAALYRIVNASDPQLRRVADFKKGCFGLRDVGLCNQLRKVHDGEERLIGSGELTSIKRAVSNHSVDGAADLGVTELRLGALIFAFRGGELAAR